MTDTPAVANFRASDLAALSPEARATFTATMKQAGFNEADVAAKLGAPASPAPNETNPAPSLVPSNAPDAALTVEQKLAGYRTLFKHAADKQAVIDAAKRDGIELKADGTAEHKPQLSRDQKAEPANSPALTRPNDVPPSPDGYRFSYSKERLAMDATALAKFSGELRSALHKASVPANLAQSVLDALDHSASLYPQTATEDQRKLIFAEQGSELRRAFGAKGAEEIVKLAAAAYQRLGGFAAKLDEQFAWHSARAQVALANIEREYRHRTGGKAMMAPALDQFSSACARRRKGGLSPRSGRHDSGIHSAFMGCRTNPNTRQHDTAACNCRSSARCHSRSAPGFFIPRAA